MAQLIKPQVKVLENNGQIQVVIDLNLNLSINSNQINIETLPNQLENNSSNKEEIDFIIPEFNSKEKIKFGKGVS